MAESLCEWRRFCLNKFCLSTHDVAVEVNLVDLEPLTERLNELANEEARLRYYVTGTSYTDELAWCIRRAGRFEFAAREEARPRQTR